MKSAELKKFILRFWVHAHGCFDRGEITWKKIVSQFIVNYAKNAMIFIECLQRTFCEPHVNNAQQFIQKAKIVGQKHMERD